MLVEGRQKLDLGQKRIEFGAYALVYVGKSNDMKKRSVPSIALKSSNDVGGYYFMSLYTGKKLHSYVWTELPIDDDVILGSDFRSRISVSGGKCSDSGYASGILIFPVSELVEII